ncbi:hypothetical protein LP417_11995 [Polaromonas sp. P1-6]|nr:hypothetical protein LP417_11995 [Polaromonas sp. P1-6]
MKRSAITLMLLASGTLSLPALAQTPKDFEELRQDLLRLRQELNQLKAQPPAAAPTASSATTERLEQLELKQKDAVLLGDIPGSFRLPGSDTSLRLYGFAELNAVHEFKGDNSANDYSTFAPVRAYQWIDHAHRPDLPACPHVPHRHRSLHPRPPTARWR